MLVYQRVVHFGIKIYGDLGIHLFKHPTAIGKTCLRRGGVRSGGGLCHQLVPWQFYGVAEGNLWENIGKTMKTP